MKTFLSILFTCAIFAFAHAQASKLDFLERPDSLNKPRFWASTGTAMTIYSTASIGLWNVWYKDFPLTSFHTFDDSGEWEDMDKVGHVFSAYIEGSNYYKAMRWTGLNHKKSILAGAIFGTVIQGTFEVMDGYSEKWGFSWYDIGANTAGVGLFAAQEFAWQEQRMVMKVSTWRPDYSTTPLLSLDGSASSSLEQRATALYGKSFWQVLVKDYNAQTLWLSINPRSFMKQKETKFPKWLNIAVGYGAENMFGGFANSWSEDGVAYALDTEAYPRYRQLYLSLDIDVTRLNIKNKYLRVLVNGLNWIKIPAPALELNTLGQVKFHPIYW